MKAAKHDAWSTWAVPALFLAGIVGVVVLARGGKKALTGGGGFDLPGDPGLDFPEFAGRGPTPQGGFGALIPAGPDGRTVMVTAKEALVPGNTFLTRAGDGVWTALSDIDPITDHVRSSNASTGQVNDVVLADITRILS